MNKCVFFAIVVICIGLLGTLWIKKGAYKYYPHSLENDSASLAISSSEKSDGVFAKFGIKETQLDYILEWYRNHGFNIVQGSLKIHGYGPNGVSFTISATNQTYILVVTQWPDL